mmetsp:Transcript_54899/g.107402  ORF Transcript_54899/g.107402 Transcript_54899/m.107402 type:complete len:220 (+) Transcript_54899:736-1395(+)
MISYSCLKDPGLSGITTDTRDSEVSALSETKRRRSKSMFAPEAVATSRFPFQPFFWTNFFIPAIAKAPAGSKTTRMSVKASLIAAQISSVLTVTISSTTCWQSLKVLLPATRTAAPSAKVPTESNSTIRPALRLSVKVGASAASTPTTFTWGATALMNAPIPDSMPPPPQQTNTASTPSADVCFKTSIAMVPCPAITSGSSNGWTRARPSLRAHSRQAA